jgi:peroxiredoxin
MRLDRPAYWLATAVLISVLAVLPARLNAMPRAGRQAPDFKVVTTSGQPVSMDNYRGHVLVMDFFAIWCRPCNESIPHLMGINRKYGKQGLQILGLSLDEGDGQEVKSFMDERRINYPVALAPEQVQLDYGIVSVPVMFVVDKKGKLAEVYRGFTNETGRSMEGLVKKLLAEK